MGYFNEFIDVFVLSGIVGTKEYRKPEWVTHMEELEVALKGNLPKTQATCMKKPLSSTDVSLDSLEASKTSLKKGKTQSKTRSKSLIDSEAPEPFFINPSAENNFCLTEGVSTASVNSEPPLKSKNKVVGFVQNAMDEYLNSHRHSLSSVMELIGISDAKDTKQEQQHSDVYFSDEDDYVEEKSTRRYSHDASSNCYFTLSPIEENSEPSTGSSTLRDTLNNSRILQTYSSSCDPIPSEPFYLNMEEKFQTFPRSANKTASYYDSTMYPLEPRELDPSGFNQLHTVDSQEELQEFLLLESECMSDQRNKGLASAFLSTDDDETSTEEQTVQHTGKLTEKASVNTCIIIAACTTFYLKYDKIHQRLYLQNCILFYSELYEHGYLLLNALVSMLYINNTIYYLLHLTCDNSYFVCK